MINKLKQKFNKRLVYLLIFILELLLLPLISVFNPPNNFSSTDFRVKTNANNLKEEKSVVNEEQDFSDNFFKVYEQENPITISPSNDLSQFGKITSLKIGGIKLWQTILKISEIGIFGQNGQPVEYQVDYLQVLDSVIEDDPALLNDGNFFDGNQDTYFKINKLQTPLDVEINILLDHPTVLSDLKIAFDASDVDQTKSSWNKIGMIEMLNTEGHVYRQEGLDLTTHKIGDSNNGAEYNFSTKTNNSGQNSWLEFAPQQGIEPQSAFMFSYRQNDALKDFKVYFGENEQHRSIVPLLVPNTNAMFEVQGAFLPDPLPLLSNPTDQQLLEFMKKVDDSVFWDTIKTTIGLSNTETRLLNVEDFFRYNENPKTGTDIESDIRFWNLSITLTNDGNSLDANSFKNFAFLGLLDNIYTLKIQADEISSYLLNIDDLNWIGNLKNLSGLYFPNVNSPNFENPRGALRVYGDPQNWDFLAKTKIMELDLTAFYLSDPENDQKLGAAIVAKDWINSLNKDFIIFAPDEKITGPNSKEVDDIFDYQIQEKYIKLVKETTIPYPSPELFQNEEGKYQFSKLLVNDQTISVKIYGGKFYWDFKNANIESKEIVWSEPDRTKFYTQAYVDATPGLVEDKLVETSTRKEPTDKPIIHPKLLLEQPGQLVSGNSGKLNEAIFVDGVRYEVKILNGNMFWNTDLSNVQYGYRKNNQNYYFSSLDKLIADVGLNNLEIVAPFSIENNVDNTNYHTYNQKIPLVKEAKDVMYDDNPSIWVDDIEYKEWIIKEGKVVWDFGKNVKIEEIKFVDNQAKYYTTERDKHQNIRPNLTSVAKHRPYDAIPERAPMLVDPGLISSPEDINQTIIVDGQEVKVTLRDGNLFWDCQIEEISFVVYDLELKQNIYFTSLSAAKGLIDRVSTITRAIPRELPAKKHLTSPLNQNSRISIDGQEYEAIYVQGRWYWNVPEEVISLVKYQDYQGYFYTELTAENYAINSMGEVEEFDLENLIIDINNWATNIPFEVDITNMNSVNHGYEMNGEHRDFVVIEDQVYFSIEDWKSTNFIYMGKDGSYKLFSSLDGLDEGTISYLFSKNVFSTNYPDVFDKAIIEPPENNKTILNIITSDGELVIVKATNQGGKLLYDNIDALNKIKYVNEKGIYFEELESDHVGTKYTSVDLFKSDLEKFAGKIEDIYSQQVQEKKLISEILVYGSISLLGVSLITLIIIRVFTSNRQGRRYG